MHWCSKLCSQLICFFIFCFYILSEFIQWLCVGQLELLVIGWLSSCIQEASPSTPYFIILVYFKIHLEYVLKWFKVNSLKSNPISVLDIRDKHRQYGKPVSRWNKTEKSQRVFSLGVTIYDNLCFKVHI